MILQFFYGKKNRSSFQVVIADIYLHVVSNFSPKLNSQTQSADKLITLSQTTRFFAKKFQVYYH